MRELLLAGTRMSQGIGRRGPVNPCETTDGQTLEMVCWIDNRRKMWGNAAKQSRVRATLDHKRESGVLAASLFTSKGSSAFPASLALHCQCGVALTPKPFTIHN